MAEGYARPALAVGSRHGRPAAAAKGARGACDCSPRPPWDSLTLSNAVPWVRPEVDTFLPGQFLVVGRKRGRLQLNHEISRDELRRARGG